LAVDIEDQADWELLCSFFDRPDLVVATRGEASILESELSDVLAAWASECSPLTAMHHLQRVGIAAAVVQDTEDLWRDVQLRSRSFLELVAQADVGAVLYAGSPQRWSKTPGRAQIPPARLGEQTREVLQQWLATTEDELLALEESGAIFTAGQSVPT
jgi:crotonobetainyl-CoA:carnitine CoA-transferase CaiB-like acyl-CoA transferase